MIYTPCSMWEEEGHQIISIKSLGLCPSTEQEECRLGDEMIVKKRNKYSHLSLECLCVTHIRMRLPPSAY